MKRSAISMFFAGSLFLTVPVAPANAAGASASNDSGQGASVWGPFTAGYAGAWIFRTDGAAVSFAAGSVPSANPTSATVGCIYVVQDDYAYDWGCEELPSAVVAVDPALQSGTMMFTVPSEVYLGGTLSAESTLNGVGPTWGQQSINETLSPATGSPVQLSVNGYADQYRYAEPSTATITSSSIGGGAILSGSGSLQRGGDAYADVETQ